MEKRSIRASPPPDNISTTGWKWLCCKKRENAARNISRKMLMGPWWQVWQAVCPCRRQGKTLEQLHFIHLHSCIGRYSVYSGPSLYTSSVCSHQDRGNGSVCERMLTGGGGFLGFLGLRGAPCPATCCHCVTDLDAFSTSPGLSGAGRFPAQPAF